MTSFPRLQQSAPLVDDHGLPTTSFHNWWNQVASALEKAFSDLSDQLAAITAAQATADTAIANAAAAAADALDAANDALTAINNAATAQSTADTVKRDDAISASFAETASSLSILTASDAGSDATITVANHDRKYGDGTSVSITGASITGLAYSTDYYVYYDDASRVGGAVTFNVTTDPTVAAPNQAAGRHFCGGVSTPAAGGTSTTGGTNPPTFCVTVDTPILMADGMYRAAGELTVGDSVLTRHEDTLVWGVYPVEAVTIVREPVFKAVIKGQTLRATATHRIWLGSCWIMMKDLGIPDGNADVVRITVTDAHTYVSNGILSHNIKPTP